MLDKQIRCRCIYDATRLISIVSKPVKVVVLVVVIVIVFVKKKLDPKNLGKNIFDPKKI